MKYSYLIAGLGNPGRQYNNTRHNLGFAAVTRLAKDWRVHLIKRRFHAKYGSAKAAGGGINAACVIMLPQTYMNLSGVSIAAFLRYFKIPPERLIVVCDDTALEAGRLRIRERGSAGGHNGLKSIIKELGTDGFIRVRIGAGSRPEFMDQAAYVLSKIPKDEVAVFDEAATRAARAVAAIVNDGAAAAMNRYN